MTFVTYSKQWKITQNCVNTSYGYSYPRLIDGNVWMDTDVINISKNFVLFLDHCCFEDVDRILYAPKLKTLFFKQYLHTILRAVFSIAWQGFLQPEFCALYPYTAPDSTKSKFHYFDIVFLRHGPVYNNFSSQHECYVDGWIIFYKALYSTKLVILSKL